MEQCFFIERSHGSNTSFQEAMSMADDRREWVYDRAVELEDEISKKNKRR